MYAEPTSSHRAEQRAYHLAPARLPDAKGDLQLLFKSYDAACLDFDADAVAAFYDLPCLISTPDGNGSFTARGEVRAAFARLFSSYRQQGLVGASLASLQIEALSAGFAQAQAVWSLANNRGADVGSVICAYTLRHATGKWRICHAVSLGDVLPVRRATLNLATLNLTGRG